MQLLTLKTHAILHPITVDINKLDTVLIAGDNPNFVLNLLFGYRIVISLEKHRVADRPSGDFFHLSFSVDTIGKLPSRTVIEILMEILGFSKNITDYHNISMEEFAPNHHAINIWVIQ